MQRPPTMSVEFLSSSAFRGVSASERPIAHLHAVSNGLWNDYRLMRCVARAGASDAVVQAALEDLLALHLGRLYVFLFSEEDAGDAVGAEDFLGARWYELRPPSVSTIGRSSALGGKTSRRRPVVVSHERGAARMDPRASLAGAAANHGSVRFEHAACALGSAVKVSYADGVTIYQSYRGRSP